MNYQPKQIIDITLSDEELQNLLKGQAMEWFGDGLTDDGRHVDIEIKIKRKPTISVTVADDTKDRDKAELLEAFINHTYPDYSKVITSIVLAKRFVSKTYGLETPDYIWDRILTSVIELDVKEKRCSECGENC